MKNAVQLAFAGMLISVPFAVPAMIIDFSSLAQAGTGFRSFGNTVSVDGLSFASSGGSFGNVLGVWQNGSANHPVGGTIATSLMEYYAGATTTMKKVDGSAFAFDAVDLASWAAGNSGSLSVTFVGTKTGGATVIQTFTVPNSGASSPILQHFTFSNSFSDLVQVSFTQGINAVSNAFQFNNISISPVPEPSSTILFGCGVVAFIISRRKIAK